MQCELCERESDDKRYFELHHLYPGKKRRRNVKRENDTITVCRTCGDQIHNMFSNQQLRNELDSIKALKTAMCTYIEWVKKKPIDGTITMKQKKRR